MLIVPNGSPYYRDKMDVRYQIVIRQIIECGLPVIYANQLGGQDELVFDGGSFVLNADHSIALQMNQFEANTVLTTWRKGPKGLDLRQGACRATCRRPTRPTGAPASWACATM